jgi:hypothetical protein
MVAAAGINEVSVATGQSRSAYSALLKQVYGPRWDSWLHTSVKISEKIAKKKGMMGGQMRVSALSTALPQSAGISSGEGYYLPHPTTGEHINPRIIARDFYTRLRWTGQSQRAARAGKQAAFSKPRKSDVEDARQQSALNFARKLYNGYFDILGRVNSVGTVTGSASTERLILTLDGRDGRKSGAYSGGTPEERYHLGAHYLRAGMMIGVATAPAGAPSMANNGALKMVQIESLDDSVLASPTITIKAVDGVSGALLATAGGATPTTFLAGDVVFPYASRQDTIGAGDTADSSYFTMNGIESVVLDDAHYSTLYGLSKTTYGKLSGVNSFGADSGSSTTLRDAKEMRLTQTIHRIRNEGSGGTPDIICLHDSTLREVLFENEGKRRFAPVQQSERGYGDLVHVAGSTTVKYMEDWLCPPGLMYALDTTVWGYYSESDLAPLDEPQQRFIPDYDQSEMIWHKSGNVECRKPHNNGVVDDLNFDLTDIPV